MTDRFAPGFPCTDPHAHLGHTLARVGGAGITGMLENYDSFYAVSAGEGPKPFILDIGTEAGDLSRRKALFGAHPSLRFSAGLWPGAEALSDIEGSMEKLAVDARDPACAALGECGLDYFHMDAGKSRQIELFMAQAELAKTLRLPLIVHSREAFEDTLRVVREYSDLPDIVIHCFGYGKKEAMAFLDLGCSVSFAGNISYKKSESLREALTIVPPDKLLLETDSPYMNPMPMRGKPSTSMDLGRTIAFASDLLGSGADDLALRVHLNAFKIFGGSVPFVQAG